MTQQETFDYKIDRYSEFIHFLSSSSYYYYCYFSFFYHSRIGIDKNIEILLRYNKECSYQSYIHFKEFIIISFAVPCMG